MPRRPALAVTASVLGFLTSVAVAAAASTVGNPVVVNNLTGSPDANVYTFSIGAEENGRFSVLWVEDQDGDYIRDAVLTRGFNARGKAIGPIVELSNDATTEDPEALGFHALPDGRLQALWADSRGATRVLASRRVDGGLATSAEKTLKTTASDGFLLARTPDDLIDLTGGTGTLVYHTPGSYHIAQIGRTGGYQPPDVNVTAPGTDLKAMSSLGKGFATFYAKPNADWSRVEYWARRYNADAEPKSALKRIIEGGKGARILYLGATGLSNGTIAVIWAQGPDSAEVWGRIFNQRFEARGAAVRLASGLNSHDFHAVALPEGGLTLMTQKASGKENLLVVQSFDEFLGRQGAAVKLGPISELSRGGLFGPLTNGNVVALYSRIGGTPFYAQVIDP